LEGILVEPSNDSEANPGGSTQAVCHLFEDQATAQKSDPYITLDELSGLRQAGDPV